VKALSASPSTAKKYPKKLNIKSVPILFKYQFKIVYITLLIYTICFYVSVKILIIKISKYVENYKCKDPTRPLNPFHGLQSGSSGKAPA
jgi:hypothetical protein